MTRMCTSFPVDLLDHLPIGSGAPAGPRRAASVAALACRSVTARPERLSSVARRYNEEWARLAAVAVPAAWGALDAFRWCATLAEVHSRVGGDRNRVPDGADQALAVLVGLAASDALAARVVLQRLLAPLVAVAHRRRGPGRPAAEVFDDLIGQAWIEVRTYPLARRPRKVAANLVRDAEYQLFTRPQRLRSSGEVPTVLAEQDADATDAVGRCPSCVGPAAEALALLDGAEARGVSHDDVELLRRLHLDGVRAEELATALNVTARTVRNRRAAAYAALARVA